MFMRHHLLAVLLAASVAVPAAGQRQETPEKRLDRIEQQLRAVQRRVFPQGGPQEIAPEVTPTIPGASPVGVPASTPVADLTARIDALESQLRQLTGQAEENGHRLAVLDEAVKQLRDTTASRLAAIEQAQAAQQQAAAAPPPAPVEAAPAEAKPVRHAAASTRKKTAAGGDAEWVSAQEPSPAVAAAGGDDAEAVYNAGFRLWEQKRYPEAIKTLETVSRKYPKHRYASWAGNLVGRAYLDDGNPGAAAKALLANYEANPKGERAADSLYFLGQALVALKKPQDACKAYDEIKDVYGDNVRDWLKQRLPAARAAARCS
jgi:TolA-binding protein